MERAVLCTHGRCSQRMQLQAVGVCTSCSSQQNPVLCVGTSLYNTHSSQNFFSTCTWDNFHSNNDFKTVNPFPAWFNTLALLIWCLGLSNLHVKQEYFHSGTWMKSFAHQVKMTSPLKKTQTDVFLVCYHSMIRQKAYILCMILSSLQRKGWLKPFYSMLLEVA